MNFYESTILGRIVKFFDFILYSDVQYDFYKNAILRRIAQIFNLYCTRTYSTIFERMLYSDAWHKFLICTALGRTVFVL